MTVDRLFGRSGINDDDIETHVTHYVAAPLDALGGPKQWKESNDEDMDGAMTDVFTRANKICWAVIFGMMGTEVFNYIGLPSRNLFTDMAKNTEDGLNPYAHILFNRGMVRASAAPGFPYFLFMPEPEKGWGEGLLSQEAYCKAFAALGEADILHALFVLHTKEPDTKFTLGYFTKATGLTDTRAERVLATLTDMGFIKSAHIELDDIRQTFYEFKPKDTFVAVLTLMRAFIETPVQFAIKADDRTKPMLQEGGT